ncbi:MAG: DNA mismatch repair protein MutS [Myxococcales bacterium]|nr:DNA mismatch repair protein MutS [Myxococcales bacterium]
MSALPAAPSPSAAVSLPEAVHSSPTDPQAVYQQRLAAAQAEAKALDRRALRMGLLRFVCFAAALLLCIAAFDGWLSAVPRAVLWLSFVAAVLGFVALIFRHAAVLDARDRALHAVEVNRRGLGRLDGSWARWPARPLSSVVTRPPYADDLDLSGPASLQLLCDATHTEPGEAALFRAFFRAAKPEVEIGAVSARQEAVRELVPLVALRQAFEIAGRRLGGSDGYKPSPEAFLRWAEGPARVQATVPGLRLWARLPWLSAPLLLLLLLRPSWGPVLGGPLLVLLVLQGVLLLVTSGAITRLMTTVASGEVALSAYADMLELVVGASFATAENRELQALLRAEGHGPGRWMRRLQGDYSYLELRRNPLVWLPLNLIFLWDLFFALRIERWQAQVGPRLRGWLSVLGELEARSSLATLAFDHPDWAWPEFVTDPATFDAQDLGHPLLSAVSRVGNDVTLPGPGRAFLVTGSNMSGKSTLLRSIGLAQVMAQAGAPVCARRLRLSPLSLRTVMRVDDSLARGVSHFYAELQRLKSALDESRGTPPLCYLLDEILHGTNTRERELGARLVVRTLCQRGSTGAVSTHDLSLATLADETQGAVHNVHFTEIVEGETMRFDFRLRTGPVQTTNALRLMRQVGMDLEWDLLREIP